MSTPVPVASPSFVAVQVRHTKAPQGSAGMEAVSIVGQHLELFFEGLKYPIEPRLSFSWLCFSEGSILSVTHQRSQRGLSEENQELPKHLKPPETGGRSEPSP